MQSILEILKLAKAAGKATNHITIKNGSWMPLTIEEIGEGPNGRPAVSVCHYYEQNGDLMRDPEMCFEIADDRGTLKMFPYSFRNDGVNVDRVVYQEIDGKKMVDLREKKDEASFARIWNRNIKDQGFIKAYAASLADVCLCGAPMENGKCSVAGCVASAVQS
jgi:hypothetical protein